MLAELVETARSLGFEVVGTTSVSPFERHAQSYAEWRASGFAAGMEYMTRRPELHCSPAMLVPHASTLISLAANYYAEAPPFKHENRFGRVARYAWGLDYHEVVKPRLIELVRQLERIAGRELRARCFVDAVPLLERAAAERAGLGFFGKNTNLLQPRKGSWFFLAEILIDLELPVNPVSLKVSCGTCTRCLDQCPTRAFDGAYRLDSRLCISYLTIENRGAIPVELREGIGEWIFGCDVCQEVCPFNRFSSNTQWEELRPESGVGSRLDLVEVLSLRSEAAFKDRFRGTPLLRAKRSGLLRNGAVVAANVGCTEAVSLLEELSSSDPHPVVRSHSLWALSKLDRRRASNFADRMRSNDPDEQVRAEAESILQHS